MAQLTIVRHGQSEWNLQNRFTGWEDVSLTEKGIEEAKSAGAQLNGMHFDEAYTSNLKRAQNTLNYILEACGQSGIQITRDEALNERHYGDLQGLDKAETAAKFGDEQVHIWRRSYDIAPPNGESLKDTAARVIPYFENEIVPKLKAGKNIIIAAHGNSLRALIMYLEKLTPEQILQREIGTARPIIYTLDADLNISDIKEY
ncbi:MAG: 2,3-bisphosphoglycerate-dependent phosphoglycerate mutase [Bacteroidota bacterium]|nr:2,3-bisphosphoglycerate-dependent phosphoglycerate mutase [Bacteroidota bacterium]MDX5430261.1 2,3-bisphosphoglycerate-dependent phosphoglycerate mutase [Bacteroidota bacterium]MDX5469022.1 2,3-bisphosphoglycerate-dependent phosphoglycerate mutase [Bacteroidota bacterium]